MDEYRLPSSRELWEREVLGKWLEIIEFSEAFRVNHIAGEKEVNIRNIYAAKLTRLWVELAPEVEGRKDFGEDFLQSFKEFRAFAFDPGMFFEKEDSARIYELEECLRLALYKLKIT